MKRDPNRINLGRNKYLIKDGDIFWIEHLCHHGFLYRIKFTKEELMYMTMPMCISELPRPTWSHDVETSINGYERLRIPEGTVYEKREYCNAEVTLTVPLTIIVRSYPRWNLLYITHLFDVAFSDKWIRKILKFVTKE